MQTTDLHSAIKARWDEVGLGSILTGGLHAAGVDYDSDIPYAVLMPIASNVRFRTASGTRADSEMFQISVFSREGLEKASEKADAVVDAFDNANLGLSQSRLVRCRLSSKTFLQDRRYANGIEYAITFDVLALSAGGGQ